MMTNDETRRAGEFGDQQRDGRENAVEAASNSHSSSYPSETGQRGGGYEGAIFDALLDLVDLVNEWREVEAEQGKRAARLPWAIATYRGALAWVEDNPRAWEAMRQLALSHAKQGKRFGGQQLVEWVRSHDYADRHGQPTGINNSYSPVLVRLLLREYPQLGEFVEQRASAFDCWFREG